MYVLITFNSTHHALAAEGLLLDASLKPDIQPVPRELSASCGLAIAVPLAAREQALQLLEQHAVAYRAIYRVGWQDKDKRNRCYQEEAKDNGGE